MEDIIETIVLSFLIFLTVLAYLTKPTIQVIPTTLGCGNVVGVSYVSENGEYCNLTHIYRNYHNPLRESKINSVREIEYEKGEYISYDRDTYKFKGGSINERVDK